MGTNIGASRGRPVETRLTKVLGDCETPKDLAEAIGYHLERGGMHVWIEERRHTQKGWELLKQEYVYDEPETRRLYGTTLRKYNELCKSNPKLPPPEIGTSDPLSGLAQIQQLCIKAEGNRPTEQEPTGASTKPKSKVKPPSKEAKQAYQLKGVANYTQAQIAGIMNQQLHRKDIKPYKVSRWLKSVKKWYEANGLPFESKPTITPTDPKALTMGLRRDGKRTGDPRIKPI